MLIRLNHQTGIKTTKKTTETAMPHSRVIQHLNDEVGYGVADQAISTSQACRESHARCAVKILDTGLQGAFAGGQPPYLCRQV
jgi:hypothetical protein